MTTITAPSRSTLSDPASPFSRVWAVTKLHFVNPSATLIIPFIVLFGILAVNIGIIAVLYNTAPEADRDVIIRGVSWSGSAFYIFIYMMIVSVQSTNLTFPFALGYGATRRDYSLGAGLAYVLLALLYTIALSALMALEQATSGWGFGATTFSTMFTSVYLDDPTLLGRTFINLVLLLFFFFTGSAVAAIYVRWRAIGLTLYFVGLGFAVIGAMALVGATIGWAALGSFFVEAGWVGSFALLLIPTAISAVTGFLLLQRATPKN